MQESLSVLSVELIPVHEKLVNLRRQLAVLSARDNVTKQDLKPIMEELRKIDGLRAFFLSRSPRSPTRRM